MSFADVIKPKYLNLDKLCNGNIYHIPVYQRPYRWEKEQINELLEDIFTHQANDKLLFLGTLYLVQTQRQERYEAFEVIDGQQRLTTLTLFALVLVDLMDNDDELRKRLWKEDFGELFREERLLELGSVEKQILKDIFEKSFDKENLYDFVSNYDCANLASRENVQKNFKQIHQYVSNFINSENAAEQPQELLRKLYKFVFGKITLIQIIIDPEELNPFEVFESINSKGKQLDEIDKIKSYIFRNISKEMIPNYLEKWGHLIIETNDSMEEYFQVYIRAFVRFYKQSIKLVNFKTLIRSDLSQLYGTKNEEDTIKRFVNELVERVQYFKLLKNPYELETKINRGKFQFYLHALDFLNYAHPRPFLFRAICAYETDQISIDVFEKIVKSCFCLMFTYQSLFNRDSKDIINIFVQVGTLLYQSSIKNKFENILQLFRDTLQVEGYTQDAIKQQILARRERNKVNRILLIFYAYTPENRNKPDYSKSKYALKRAKDLPVDHILPQKPDVNDTKIFYGESNTGALVLSDGEDFSHENENVYEGMDYKIFVSSVLDKIGNLRIVWNEDNIRKLNKIDANFNSYANIQERSKKMSEKLSESELFVIQ